MWAKIPSENLTDILVWISHIIQVQQFRKIKAFCDFSFISIFGESIQKENI